MKKIKKDYRLYRYLLIAFSALGIGAMVYLSLSFSFNIIPQNSCSVYNTTVDCGKVIASPYSTLFGISLYDYGIVFFSVMFALSGIHAFFIKNKKTKYFLYAIFTLSLLGAAAAFYLIYLEIFKIGAICLLCTIGHASIFAMLTVSAYLLRKKL